MTTHGAHLRVAVLLAAVGLPGVPSVASAQSDEHLERAKALMREVPLIDGHNDLPWAVRARGLLSFDSLDLSQDQPRLMTDVARLRKGLVGAQFWSTWTPVEFEGQGAARAGMEQGDVVRRMAERYPEVFEMASTADDIVRIHRAGRIASMMGLEGGQMIENSLGLLRAFYREGVRYMTLAHSRNTDWTESATDEPEHGGLTKFGEEVVREMNRMGMLVDLSHASDSAMWDVLRVAEVPVIFSHSSSRHFVPHPRNVPDDIARAVAENGGVIMVTFVPEFISMPAYEYGQRRDSVIEHYRSASGDNPAIRDSVLRWIALNPMPRPDVGVVADHIEHLRDVAGVDHVGIGSDFDGISATPIGLEDVSTYPVLIAELLQRRWSDGDVKRVLGLNLLRAMREAERTAARLQAERPPSTAQIELLDEWETPPPLEGPVRR